MHVQVLRELADVLAKSLFHHLCKVMGKQVPVEKSKAKVTAIFKKGKEDAGNHRLASLTFILGKMTEQLILDVIFKHVEEKVIRSGQHGFTKGKSCLTNLIASYNGMIDWVNEGTAVTA